MGARTSLLGLGIVAGLGLVAFGGWYAFLRGSEPPPVSLEAAVKGLEASTATKSATPAVAAATTATKAALAPSTPSTPATTRAARQNLHGAWALEGGSSFVGYRVNEQVAQVGANTAVGRTSTVAGQLSFDGSRVSDLRVTADLRALRSDDSRRDNYLRQRSLETARFPEAVFVLAEPIAVNVTAAEGASLAATAKGELTVHGVTKRVDVPVEGKFTNGKLVVVGSTRVAFADFGIAKPRVPLVLSIEDDAVIELSLVFAPAGG